MEQFSYRITDTAGIHARPAGLIVKEAAKYKSHIKISANGKEADAKKIFAVMSLGIRNGEEIIVTIDGEDEKDAKTALSAVIGENL
ncbi:MAG: HPr family phosphocarrier protein [Clostridiales bacterium]|nr:HPr family phosphocarrier protein [Clostridiales bacterium]